MGSKPNHHYVLAHIAIRQVCQANPLAFFGIMASEERDQFLDRLWTQVRKTCDPTGDPGFSIRDVTVTPCRVKQFPCVVLTMPEPPGVADAHFVGVVLKMDLTQANPPEKPEIEYITLEKGVNMDGTPRTVLCSWNENAHSNYGDGPPATLDDFVAAIEKFIGRSSGANGNS